MSREEVKSAINELLDSTSEQVLNEVFEYLKTVESKSEKSVSLALNFRKILAEDENLLDRLAQ